MQGVTTAIVAFIFVCLVYPHIVKHRPQFHAAIGLVLLGILLDAIGHVDYKDNGGLVRVTYFFAALLQIITILLLVLCVGGLSVRELASDVARTVEVIRRGEDKPVLVPLRGEQPRSRDEEAPGPAPVNDVKDQSPIPLE
jgi:hypothetical protein